MTLAGAAIALVVLILIVFAPWLATHPPTRISLGARLAPPSLEHFFGTDEVGRDLFSRVIYGARASCGAAFAIVLISTAIGVIVGCFSGILGGRVDTAIMRLMDVLRRCRPSSSRWRWRRRSAPA